MHVLALAMLIDANFIEVMLIFECRILWMCAFSKGSLYLLITCRFSLICLLKYVKKEIRKVLINLHERSLQTTRRPNIYSFYLFWSLDIFMVRVETKIFIICPLYVVGRNELWDLQNDGKWINHSFVHDLDEYLVISCNPFRC